MSFLSNLVSEFVQNQPGSFGQQPPQLPEPWYTERNSSGELIYINGETGQRSNVWPPQGHFSQGAANWAGRKVGDAEAVGDDARYDYDRAKYGAERRFDNAEDDVRYAEDRVEYGARRRWDNAEQRVEDVPQDIAYGAGEAVGDVRRWGQDVEDIPGDIRRGARREEDRVEGGLERFGQSIEGGFDRFVGRVEDIPQDAAYDVGRVEGDVDRFGNQEQNAFDSGRDDGRYGNDGSYDRY